MQMRRAFTTGIATMLLGTALFVGGGAVAADTDSNATVVTNPLPMLAVNFDGKDYVGEADIAGNDSDPNTTSSTPEIAVSGDVGQGS